MIGRAAAALAVALACGAEARADAASEAMLREFVASLQVEDWTAAAASIRSDGADTIAEGISVSRRDPKVSIGVAELRVRDLDEHPDGGGFSASAIEVTDAALSFEDGEYRIPAARAVDASVPTFEGITIDMHRLMTTISRYYSVAARARLGELVVPEATLTSRFTDAEAGTAGDVRVVYRDIRVAGFNDGMIETQTVGPVTIETRTPDAEVVSIEIARLAAERLDLGAMARIFDDTQYREGRGDGVWRPIAARVAYSGFSGSGPDGVTFHLKDISVDNIDGRQPDLPFTQDFDQILDPDVSDEAKAELALAAVTNMYSAWRVGTIRVDDVGVAAPKEGGEFALGSMTMSGLSSDGIDSFVLKDMRAKGPGGFGSLESFEFAGMVFPKLEALMQFAALESDVDAAKHEEAMRAAFAGLPRLAHLGLSNFAGGKSEAEKVTLRNFSVDLTDWNDLYAQATDIRLEGLEIPGSLAKLDPQAEEFMNALGFERLVFAMSLVDRWTPETGADEATWTFRMQDAGDIELSYALTGVTIDWLLAATAAASKSADGQAALMAMLDQLGLRRAALKVTDRSLLDRGFGLAAKMQNLTIDGAAYRQQMRGALPFLLSAAVPTQIAKLLTKPLQEFMAGGQTLVAEIAPPAPIPLNEIMAASGGDPMALPAKLGLQLRTEASPQ